MVRWWQYNIGKVKAKAVRTHCCIVCPASALFVCATQKLERPDQRQRLLRKFEGILRNKKLVYKDVDSRVIRK